MPEVAKNFSRLTQSPLNKIAIQFSTGLCGSTSLKEVCFVAGFELRIEREETDA